MLECIKSCILVTSNALLITLLVIISNKSLWFFVYGLKIWLIYESKD